MNYVDKMTVRIRELEAENEQLRAENERVVNLLADPKLISVEVDKACATVSVQPREDIMRHLFVMMAHVMGDSKNYVECGFGPDPKTGKTYELTLRYHLGKTPGQVHEEEAAELKRRADEAEKDTEELDGFLDRIDIQISEALERMGKFPGKPAGFPDRVDALCDVATRLYGLCENLLKQFDAHIESNDGNAYDDKCESSPGLDGAIDAIREHVSPNKKG